MKRNQALAEERKNSANIGDRPRFAGSGNELSVDIFEMNSMRSARPLTLAISRASSMIAEGSKAYTRRRQTGRPEEQIFLLQCQSRLRRLRFLYVILQCLDVAIGPDLSVTMRP